MATAEFSGKTALVTGAGSGIGCAVARALVAQGAHVVAIDVDALALHGMARELHACETRVLDVADARAVDALVHEVERERPIDLLANVAGVLEPTSILDTDPEAWQRTFRVNSDGVFFVSRSVARYMCERRAGAIVNVTSNAAHIPRMRMAAYAASKAAASMFTKCLGLELAAAGVRCNSVAPGSTDTPMQHALWTSPDAQQRVIAGDQASYRSGIPLGRIAAAADVVEAVLFLLSERARHITMHELVVDGGATLGA